MSEANKTAGVEPLRVHAVLWDDAPTTYEVRKPGRGTADDYEPGECLGVFETRAEADAFARCAVFMTHGRTE